MSSGARPASVTPYIAIITRSMALAITPHGMRVRGEAVMRSYWGKVNA
jgi:hypothetical protein